MTVAAIVARPVHAAAIAVASAFIHQRIAARIAFRYINLVASDTATGAYLFVRGNEESAAGILAFDRRQSHVGVRCSAVRAIGHVRFPPAVIIRQGMDQTLRLDAAECSAVTANGRT